MHPTKPQDLTADFSGSATAADLLDLADRHVPILIGGPSGPPLQIEKTFGPWVCWSMNGSRRWGFRQTLQQEIGDGDHNFALAAPSASAKSLRSPSVAAPLSPTNRIAQLLLLERQDLSVVLVLGIAVGLLSLAVPVAVQSLVTTVAFGTLLQPLFVITALLLVALGASAYLRALQVRVVEMLQRRIFVRVVGELGRSLPKVKSDAFATSTGPELLNRFFDIFTTQKSLASLLLGGLDAVLIALVGMLVLAFYHPILLIFDIVLLGIAFSVFFLLGRRGAQSSIAESKAKYAVAGWLEQIARHPIAFKHGGGEDFAAEQTDALARTYLQRRESHFRVVFRQLKGALGMQVIASVALLAIGGYLVIARELTLGQLVASELIVTAVVASIAKLGNKVEIWFDLVAAMDKLGEILDLELEDTHGRELLNDTPGEPSATYPLRVNHLALELRDDVSGRRTTSTISFEVMENEMVLISGLRTSEAYAVSSQLFGLSNQLPGKIFLGVHDMHDVQLQDWRARVALFRQEEVLPGSVRQNLLLADPNLRATDIWEILSWVQIAERVQTAPEGLDADAELLAGLYGRRFAMSLTLARLLASKPAFVIIDGALDVLSPVQRLGLLKNWKTDRPAGLVLLSDDENLGKSFDRHIVRPVHINGENEVNRD